MLLNLPCFSDWSAIIKESEQSQTHVHAGIHVIQVCIYSVKICMKNTDVRKVNFVLSKVQMSRCVQIHILWAEVWLCFHGYVISQVCPLDMFVFKYIGLIFTGMSICACSVCGMVWELHAVQQNFAGMAADILLWWYFIVQVKCPHYRPIRALLTPFLSNARRVLVMDFEENPSNGSWDTAV